MKVMHNPKSNLWKFTRSYKFGLEALFFFGYGDLLFLCWKKFFLGGYAFLFVYQSSSFGCAWFDIFKDIMIHIDR